MLRIARTMKELDFDRLAEIYTKTDKNILFRYLQEEFFTRPEEAYYIWEREGEYCSALRLEGYENGLLLTALETRPDRRRRGCAGALIRAALGSLPEGTRVLSHVERSNRTSLAVHAACGFAVERDSARLLDGTVTSRYVTLSVTVSQVSAEIS